ncbi:hypothetical protein A1D31_39945 [Bradyrhizobium liaoningense]|nr:hypothetical protein A1D31_39945 [Bradyrhizobium liaoningense]
MRVALSLDQSVFPVQGPPGSGKTHAGARMICALVRDKRTVGVTANTHKIIRHLLDKSLEAAAEQQLAIQSYKRPRTSRSLCLGSSKRPRIQISSTGSAMIARLAVPKVGFGRAPEASGIVDVLFVNEAAQMSLANVLAVSQAAESIVLLGDPRQLEQPIQGSHPDGVATSALDHVLGGHATVEAGRELFLEET